MSLSRADVRYAYIFVLGREPENETVIAQYMKEFDSVWDLRDHFLKSPEYLSKSPPAGEKSFVLHYPPEEVETAMNADVLAQVINKTATYWSKIGQEAPHWSVQTESKFLPHEIERHKSEFYAEGSLDVLLMRDLLTRGGRSINDFKCAVEFGCGVGRGTVHLAQAFPKLIAIDISPAHLKVARQEVEARGLRNVEFLQATAEDFMPAQGYDVWYSRLVLQHNPPPVTLAVIDRALERLPKHGMAIIHVRTWSSGYRFSVSDYLRDGPSRDMEMHASPQKAILLLERFAVTRIRSPSW